MVISKFPEVAKTDIKSKQLNCGAGKILFKYPSIKTRQ